MTVSVELIGILVTVIVQALYLAFKIGKFENQLNELEKKQDKHNDVISRTYKIENDVEKAHLRIDFLEEELKKNENI